jgi:hypothetical protein
LQRKEEEEEEELIRRFQKEALKERRGYGYLQN